MADRHTFHFKHLKPFTHWLEKNGWEIQRITNYEVLKAVKNKQWVIAYQKANAKEHFTLTNNSIYVFNQWRNELKIRQMVCDEIRQNACRNYKHGTTEVMEYLIMAEDLDDIEEGYL